LRRRPSRPSRLSGRLPRLPAKSHAAPCRIGLFVKLPIGEEGCRSRGLYRDSFPADRQGPRCRVGLMDFVVRSVLLIRVLPNGGRGPRPRWGTRLDHETSKKSREKRKHATKIGACGGLGDPISPPHGYPLGPSPPPRVGWNTCCTGRSWRQVARLCEMRPRSGVGSPPCTALRACRVPCQEQESPPVPLCLIVLPKSCSCRCGPCPPPPSPVWRPHLEHLECSHQPHIQGRALFLSFVREACILSLSFWSRCVCHSASPRQSAPLSCQCAV